MPIACEIIRDTIIIVHTASFCYLNCIVYAMQPVKNVALNICSKGSENECRQVK